MKFSVLAFLFLGQVCVSQIPPGYYNSAAGLSGSPLKIALYNIIKNHTSISYNNLWTAYPKTDKKANGKVWDMYSDVPAGTPPYQYTFVTDQCGNYSTEGDCYNREHSWPQSWFNSVTGPVSDLFHIYPTDGKVNGERNNYPYGNVASPTWTSLNGGKLGPCSNPGYNQTVFEPIDAYKGDFARGYFYMSTRYYSEDSGWLTSDATNKATILPWEVNVLLQWHHQDPVSAKEIARNDSVYYKIQHNRNPYIDHPEWADSVWTATVATFIKEQELNNAFSLYPNPAEDEFHVINKTSGTKGIHVLVRSLNGSTIYESSSTLEEAVKINCTDWAKGIYFISVVSEKGISNFKFIKV
jgi:endonuclease I